MYRLYRKMTIFVYNLYIFVLIQHGCLAKTAYTPWIPTVALLRGCGVIDLLEGNWYTSREGNFEGNFENCYDSLLKLS